MTHDVEAPARAADAGSYGRVGDWMQTYTGKMFWPLDPRPDEICIEDIAHSLSLQCRFMGNCIFHYSVAQHSVYVSQVVPREHALVALMHDATEAYCGDVVRPLKRFLAGYQAIEDRLWVAIAEKFDMPREIPQAVHAADNSVLLAEKDQVMGASPAEWHVPGTKANIFVTPWTPLYAKRRFMQRFEYLTTGKDTWNA